ncbi:hypothetical protein FHS18_003158 [Paenibacillus phyllosphaerae]|uniref:Uncharacterized protein n=1 Tax=Paenibacillus phyllosphaerae TaxID=274593 RepID=A0A7W5AYG3_9BACL|nr:hypothetical protein [Paenibacillus phyllosphaerae]MBB3111090.1 hypothetical protein [Paenibacillus phyllosphaerae]
MTSSRNHQEATGLGQAEEQLNQQAQAAAEIQGLNKVDKEIQAASQEHATELDDIIEKYTT